MSVHLTHLVSTIKFGYISFISVSLCLKSNSIMKSDKYHENSERPSVVGGISTIKVTTERKLQFA